MVRNMRPEDMAALGTSMIPVVGDALGAYADYTDIKENWDDVPWLSKVAMGGAALIGAIPILPSRAQIHSGADALGDVARQKITAYHGSPHDFDKFSMDAIGTGEGGQAYGHGLYAGEAQGTGFQYYKQGLEKNLNRPLSMVEEAVAKKKASGLSPMDAMGELADEGWEFDGIQKSLDTIYNNPAKFYQIEIDASPDEFLDWDLPLSEQSGLGEKLKRMGVEIEDEYGMSGFGPTIDPDGTTSYKALDDAEYGGQWLEAATRATRGDPGNGRFDQPAFASSVSDRLKKSGIKGIRYKDRFSRGADGGTSNYVVFDENLISIAKKYGIAIPAAAAMLARETGQDPATLYEEGT
jgi:hypothetical protein